MLKFIYSEKAAKLCEIFTLLLSYLVPVKSKVTISQHFVALSEYMNFKTALCLPCYEKDTYAFTTKYNYFCTLHCSGIFAAFESTPIWQCK